MSDHEHHGMDAVDVLSDGEYFVDAVQCLSDHDALSESEQIEYVGDLTIPFFSPKNDAPRYRMSVTQCDDVDDNHLGGHSQNDRVEHVRVITDSSLCCTLYPMDDENIVDGVHYTKNKGNLMNSEDHRQHETHPLDHLLSPPSSTIDPGTPIETPVEMVFDERIHDHLQQLVSPPTTALTPTTPTEKTSHLFTPQMHGIEYLQILNDNEMSTTLPTIPWQQYSNHSQTADNALNGVNGVNAVNPRPLAQSITEQFMSPEVDYDYAAALETQSVSPSITMSGVPSFPEIFKRFNSKIRPPPKRQSFNKYGNNGIRRQIW